MGPQDSVTQGPPPLDSGLICLSMLAQFFEKSADYDQLRHRHGDPANTADEIALVRYAREIGFKASAIESAWEKLSRTPLPCLARHKEGGWFILAKVAEDKVLIQDPRIGRPEQLSREEFEARWDTRITVTRHDRQREAAEAELPPPIWARVKDTILGGSGVGIMLGDAGDDLIYGNDGYDTLQGGTGNDILLGDEGNDTLFGGAGDDRLHGGAGSNVLVGGQGADVYVMGSGFGAEVVDNGSRALDGDILSFTANVAKDQLWFQRAGDDLKVSIIGTNDSATIQNWYAGVANHLSSFKLANGTSLEDGQVENLVQAMASFSPQPLGQTQLSIE